MSEDSSSLHKNKKNSKYGIIKTLFIVLILIFSLLSSFIFIFLQHDDLFVQARSGSFTPSSPSGPTTGDKDIEHEFTVYTIEVGSYWRFDWGDGTLSSWIRLADSSSYIAQTHSWDEHGEYWVKVQHRSRYLVESDWSEPLIITISESVDLDGDGWSNEIEQAYGTDLNDAASFPTDIDNDGTPDDDSSDSSYAGDADDDNDGLNDKKEGILGSNPLDNSDVQKINFGGIICYFVDINNDKHSDIFYNSKQAISSEITLQDGKMYFDVNGDGGWDYYYANGALISYQPFPWLYVILGIILVVALIIIALFKTGVIYLYEEEYIVEE